MAVAIHRRLPFLLLLILPQLLSLLRHASPAAQNLAGDAEALLRLADAVGGGGVAADWRRSDTTKTPCSWRGVTCSGGRVVTLRLPGRSLSGVIPSGTIGDLSALRILSLRSNAALSGQIPPDIGGLRRLRSLYLQGNRFSGEIPLSLFSISTLVRLDISSNTLSGPFSARFGNLSRLRTLNLEGNDLSGEIPDLKLPNLARFNVSFNRLSGPVPASLAAMPATAFLGMTVCGGPLPPCTAPPPSLPPPAASRAQGGKRSSKLSGGAIAGITVGGFFFIIVVAIVVMFLCRRRAVGDRPKSAAAKAPAELNEARSTDGSAPPTPSAAVAEAAASGLAADKRLVFVGGRTPAFDFDDLLRASAEVLGNGGGGSYGSSFKAVLESGKALTVKRLSNVAIGEKEFREKTEEIGSMDHPNLVPLHAFYYSKDEKLLVFDFVPHGSLSKLLHDENQGSLNSWEARRSIALSVAAAVEYIHQTSPTACHGNLKPSNILIGDMGARVAEQCLLRLAGTSPGPGRAQAAAYRAPETTELRRGSKEADVFSFGVILMELLTGKKPTKGSGAAGGAFGAVGFDLPRWVRSVEMHNWVEVFDELPERGPGAVGTLERLMELAVECTAPHPGSRPAMSIVVARIDGERFSTTSTASGGGDMPSFRRTVSSGGGGGSSRVHSEVGV